jgi:hypothetical protein
MLTNDPNIRTINETTTDAAVEKAWKERLRHGECQMPTSKDGKLSNCRLPATVRIFFIEPGEGFAPAGWWCHYDIEKNLSTFSMFGCADHAGIVFKAAQEDRAGKSSEVPHVTKRPFLACVECHGAAYRDDLAPRIIAMANGGVETTTRCAKCGGSGERIDV